MPSHTYKHIEITGSSTKGSDDAISSAIAQAAKTLNHLHWYEVIESRGFIDGGKVQHWQVTLKVGFRLEG